MSAFLVLVFGCSDYEIHGVDDVREPLDREDRPPMDEEEEEEDPIVPGEPVADAGPDQQVAPLDLFFLEGGASYDPDGGDITKYKWTLVSVPSGSTATILGEGNEGATMWADLAGDYVIELTVQNDQGVWDSTPDEIVVSAVPNEGFYVQMSWDTTTDLDLHLLDGNAKIFENPGDCNFCNMWPEWGGSGNADNPSLDWDTVTEGYGPETITIDSPASGKYSALVHYYGEGGSADCWGQCPPATATVDIYLNGAIVASYTETLQDAGDTWKAASIEFPSQTVKEIGTLDKTNKITCDW